MSCSRSRSQEFLAVSAAALLAIVSSFNVEISDLTGNEMEVVENFEEAMVGEDW